MDRPFNESDNMKHFAHEATGEIGTLEYPLIDPGSAQPGEGILWITTGWIYVSPHDVEPEGGREITIGNVYTFDYPAEFVTLPEYTAHARQPVRIIRQLTDTEADQDNEKMYLVEALDGWQGHAWESELAE